jgi:hypothetical protein
MAACGRRNTSTTRRGKSFDGGHLGESQKRTDAPKFRECKRVSVSLEVDLMMKTEVVLGVWVAQQHSVAYNGKVLLTRDWVSDMRDPQG